MADEVRGIVKESSTSALRWDSLVMIRLPRVKFNTLEASLIPGVLLAMDILLAILPSTTSHGAPTRVLSSYLTIAPRHPLVQAQGQAAQGNIIPSPSNENGDTISKSELLKMCSGMEDTISSTESIALLESVKNFARSSGK